MHTLTPARSHAATSAKDAIHHEKTLSEELADTEAQMAAAENESWLASQQKAVRRRTTDHTERRRMIAQLVSQACGLGDDGQPLYGANDVEGWLRDSDAKGCAEPAIGSGLLVALSRIDRVPNARLRAHYLKLKEAGGDHAHAPSDVARRLGWTGTSLERLLGIESTPGTRDQLPTLRLFLPYEDAVRVADALGMTYQEAGL